MQKQKYLFFVFKNYHYYYSNLDLKNKSFSLSQFKYLKRFLPSHYSIHIVVL